MIIITELSKIKEDLFKIKWIYGIENDILNDIKETDLRIYNMFHGIEVGTVLTYDRYNGKTLTVIDKENDVLTLQSAEPLDYNLQAKMTLFKIENTIRREYDPT